MMRSPRRIGRRCVEKKRKTQHIAGHGNHKTGLAPKERASPRPDCMKKAYLKIPADKWKFSLAILQESVYTFFESRNYLPSAVRNFT